MKKLFLMTILLAGCATSGLCRHPEPRSVRIDTLRIGSVLAYVYDTLYVAAGEAAPEFRIVSEDGRELRSTELRGKTVVLNFWITTCGPCRRELKRVREELIDRFPAEEFAFLAVGAGETAETAAQFRERTGLDFPLWYDPGYAAFSLFSSRGCPRNYVIDPEGRIVLAEKGYDDEKFARLVDAVAQTIENSETEAP